MRLIPAAVLEPRLRMIEDGEVIDGPAFDIDAVLAEHGIPSAPRRASPVLRDKIMRSFEFSSLHANRFNAVGDEGVYYAGTTLPAAIEEIRYHLQTDDGVPFDRTRVYRVITGRISGRFVDLRGVDATALDPDPATGYPAGARLANLARKVADGIIYPSVRHAEGTCLAVFRPDAIEDVRLDRLISFEPLPGPGRHFGYRLHVQPHQLQARQLEVA